MQKKPVELRFARKDDLETIVKFNNAMALETEGKNLDVETLRRGVESVLEDSSLGFYLIAEEEGKITGSLMITKEWSDWRNGVFWWIQRVYVEPEFRRKGTYRAMHKFTREEAARADKVIGIRLYVDRENVIAQKTYQSLGMAETNYRLYEEMV